MAKVIISDFLARQGLQLAQKTPGYVSRRALNTGKSIAKPDSNPRGARTRHLHQQRHRRQTPAETCFLEWCSEETSRLKNEGLFKSRPSPIMPSVQAPYIKFSDHPQKFLNFTSYDYLGLANDPEVIMAYVRGLTEQGSQGAVRFMEGVREWTLNVERSIASFHNKEACFSYASVSEALSALYYSVYGDNGIVLADEYNTILHRGQVQVQKYKHMDMEDLAEKLHKSKDCQRKVIVTDGVFSQTGEVTPLRAIMDLAEDAGATVILNDTHGIGCLGAELRGTESQMDLQGRYHDNLLVTCELGYGLGQIVGGYMVGSAKILHDHVGTMTSHPIYTVDLSAAASAAISTIFHKLSRHESEAAQIRQRSVYLRESLQDLGLSVKGGDHPIVSVAVGKAKVARAFAKKLKDRGHVVSVITDPQLLLGDTHVRFIVTSAHTDSHVSSLIDDVGSALDVMRQKCAAVKLQ